MPTDRKVKKKPKRSATVPTREALLNVRCGVHEYAGFKRGAAAAGEDLSTWVRRQLRAASIKETGDKDLFRILPE